MKLLFDFFPILLFFLFFKLFGIYTATAAAMLSSVFQVLLYRLKYRRYEPIYLISMFLILFLGGATLLFRNPVFIKWKPTGIYWLTAIVFLGSTWITQRPLIQTMMQGKIQLTQQIWSRLNQAWAIFFLIMGCLNLYVAYYYTTDTWVNFKLFGGAGLTLLFVFLQALYLAKHAKQT